jgi:hypothetical protein
MSAATVFCYVLNGNVSVVSDLGGQVTNVVCPHFVRLSHRCQLKDGNLGFFGGIVARASDIALGSRAIYCEFGDPNAAPVADLSRNLSGGGRNK